MRVRMIMGEYEDQEAYALDVFLAPVDFPMEVERVGDVDLDQIPEGENADEVTLTSEDELHRWAQRRFAAYGIWSMPVPDDSIRED